MDTSTIITGPASIVAALPHLLGFVPRDSLVVVWISAGRIALTQRIDLPDPPSDAGAIAEHLVRTGAHADATEVVTIVVASPGTGRQVHAELVGALGDVAQVAGLHVLDALHLEGERFWSYLCAGECCPVQGRLVEAGEHERIARAFGSSAPVEGRESLEEAWMRDLSGAARVERLIIDLEAEDDAALREPCIEQLEAWRDSRIDAIDSWLVGSDALDDTQWAHLLIGLCDVRVRDTIVWQLAQRELLTAEIAQLGEGLTRAPDGYVAPIATLLAVCCWQAGDGARAMIAIERALDDDAGYGLARLAEQAVSSGLPPSSWRQMMRDMSRDECRVPRSRVQPV